MSFVNSNSSVQYLAAQATPVERAYVWCLISGWTVIERNDIRVNPQELYVPELGIILTAIIELYDEGVSPDMVSIAQRLTDKWQFYPTLKTINNQYLVELATWDFVYANLRKYESMVKENALKLATQKIVDRIGEDTERSAANILKYWQELIELSTTWMGNGARWFDITHAHKLADKIAELDGKELYWYSFGKEFQFLDRATKWVQRGKTYRIGAPSNTWKAMPYYERVLTPRWFTNIGSLEVWDIVNNSYGWTSTITWVFPQWVKPIYRMRFSDWTFVDSCENHLWAVHNNDWASKDYKVMEVKDLISSWVKNKNWKWNKFSVPLTSPTHFENNNELMIDPYVLWILLSEWNLWKSHIQITNTCPEVKSRVASLLPEWDSLSTYSNSSITYWVVWQNTLKSVRDYWLALHRSWEKFIPNDYLFSTPTERKELLEWLIDWDWCVSNSAYVYTTVSQELAEWVRTIAQSLWWLVTISPHKKSFLYKWEKKLWRVSYDVRISLPFSLNLSVDYKNDIKHRTRALRKSIVDIEYLWDMDCVCIAVDAKDHLYITSWFTLTHNTQLAYSVINNLLAQWAKVMFLTLENEVQTTLGYLMSNHQKTSMDSIMRWYSPPDFEYLQSINDRLSIVDGTFYLSDIFTKVMEFQPDVVILDYIWLMSIKGFTEEAKYTEYAIQVQRFVKQVQVSWIDLSNLPTTLQNSDDIRGNPQFYGSTFLRNNTDVWIHVVPWKQFYELRDKILWDDIFDIHTKDKIKRLSGITLYLSKNRLWPHSISWNFIVDFSKWAEFSEFSNDMFKSLSSSFWLW